ncbi:cell division protein FtsQ/DivIB [Eupransor demetentiae]|uniref:Cell division septal protein FtsQ (FtsQ) n=1 Tax=Eupransor demetentiae TaxID=3109584 RepID=A0ABM9N4V2_9LACO|nr:Cell division septal protein FtsQ (FtsQ) [Lactobacillaceae bacterium LMG 33000]
MFNHRYNQEETNAADQSLIGAFWTPLKSSVFIFLTLIAVIIAVWRPWETISDVQVQSVNVTAENLKKQLSFDQKIYRYQVVGQEYFLAQKLKQANPKVATAKVSLQDDIVHIGITEKIDTGFVLYHGNWYELDTQGNRTHRRQPDGTAPVYSGFKDEKVEKQVAVAFASLSYVVRHNVSQIIFSPDKNNRNRLVMVMNDGNTAYVSVSTFAQRMQYYPGIAAQMKKAGVVDLQFGSFSYPYDTALKSKINLDDSSASSSSHSSSMESSAMSQSNSPSSQVSSSSAISEKKQN